MGRRRKADPPASVFTRVADTVAGTIFLLCLLGFAAFKMASDNPRPAEGGVTSDRLSDEGQVSRDQHRRQVSS